uniref:Uncharacterized protein n=1 Tax=Arundo donax TaxID=35708 RepID=A0A0A9CBE7_ARUDO
MHHTFLMFTFIIVNLLEIALVLLWVILITSREVSIEQLAGEKLAWDGTTDM